MKHIRDMYSKYGVSRYYQQHAGSYSNPHAKVIKQGLSRVLNSWDLPRTHILDLASGTGLVTDIITKLGCTKITMVDPYLGKSPTIRLSFDDLAMGRLHSQFNLTICCFALHLLEVSKLPVFLYSLSIISPKLLVISPHKKPEIRHSYKLVNSIVLDRVYYKYYLA